MNEQPTTFDLTPTPQDYSRLARLFARQIVDDAHAYRQQATGQLLGNLVTLVAHLARVLPPNELLTLVNVIAQDAERPRLPCGCTELPWAKGRCPNVADGPDGWCDECRDAVAENTDGAR